MTFKQYKAPELEIACLHVRPTLDGNPIYPAIYIDSKATSGAIYLDGIDVKLMLHENARLKDEIELLLHVGKESE